MIRFLQISDIHFANVAGCDDEFRQMKSKFLEDIKQCHKEMGRIDHILICGDIAFSGMETQYKEAKSFIAQICKNTGCTDGHPFVVPGNHDKKREVYCRTRQMMRNALLKGKSTQQLLSSKIREPMAVGILYAPFKQYYKFAADNSCISDVARKSLYFPESDQEKGTVPKYSTDDAFYWSEPIGELGGMTVIIHGGNSALLSDKDDGEGHSLKDGQHLQVLPLQAYNIEAKENEIHLLMLHHPLSHVLEGGDIESEIDNRFQLQLYGHVHKQSSSSGSAIHIYSGALQPPETDRNNEYFPVYNVMEVDVVEEAGQHYLKVDVFSRKWDGAKFDEYADETKTGDNALKVKLPSNDAWKKTKKKIGTGKPDTRNLESATLGIYPHIVKHRFLQSGKEGRIIKKMYGDRFDSLTPNRLKYLEFLKQVEMDGKMNELDEILKNHGK